MTKLFRIYETDLAALESTLPCLVNSLGEALNRPEVQVMAEQVKEILSNVRWDYGPPQEVRVIPVAPRDDD